MAHVTDFIYHVEELTVPAYPGLTITEGWLEVCIERINGDLDWYIEGIQLENKDGKIETFRKGSFLFDAIVPALHKDFEFGDRVLAEALEHI